jgi:hypothetical protein
MPATHCRFCSKKIADNHPPFDHANKTMPLIPHHRRSISVLCFALYVLLGAVLLLRPHQETFIGLDSSAIRMMTHAMVSGRPQIGTDATLQQVPEELRHLFLYIPGAGRLTRDRSFQLDDVQTCTYRPWFYPFIAYASAAFDYIIPGKNTDYFLPSLALAFFIAAGWFMASKTGAGGLVPALTILVGLPLFPWFARGYFPELAGMLGICLVLLHWLHAEDSPRTSMLSHTRTGSGHLTLAAFLLGLCVCFHPLLLPWAGVGLFLILSNPALRTSQVILALCGFFTGLIPLVVMTHTITQPYGLIFSPAWMYTVFQGSTLFFLFLCAALLGIVLLAVILTQSGRSLLHVLLYSASGLAHLGRLLLALIPVIALLHAQQTTGAVMEGLRDLWSIARSPYGILVAATILASFHPRVRPRSRALLVATVAVASIYLYLKGIEPFGLWSQRRLLPILLPFTVAAMSIWRDFVAAPTSDRQLAGSSRMALLIGMGLILALMLWRHPGYYVVQAEKGADAVVQRLAQYTQHHWTIYDYHQYGSPLAALGQPRTLAISNRISESDQREIVKWAASAAQTQNIIWATAHDNPGLEAGVALDEILAIDQPLPRLLAKRALPAESREHDLRIRLLRMRPLQTDTTPNLDKILGRGILALRGPWGRSDITLRAPDGRQLPARWTREGSAVIGPVPPPGEHLLVELTAGAYRGGDIDHQILRIIPPWDGPALELRVNNPHTVIQGVLTRPEDATGFSAQTGRYTLSATYPYDPAQQGIKGFAPDLGVLLHRIRMQVEGQEANLQPRDDAQ